MNTKQGTWNEASEAAKEVFGGREINGRTQDKLSAAIEALNDLTINFGDHIYSGMVKCEICVASLARARAVLAKVRP